MAVDIAFGAFFVDVCFARVAGVYHFVPRIDVGEVRFGLPDTGLDVEQFCVDYSCLPNFSHVGQLMC